MATMRGFVARGLAVGEGLWLRWCEQRHSKELPKLRGIIMLMIFALKNDIASSGRSRRRVGAVDGGVEQVARAAAVG